MVSVEEELARRIGRGEEEEIALSILAGLVAVRRGGRGGWLDQGRGGGGH